MEDARAGTMKAYKTVFAGIDFTPLGSLTAATAVELARQLDASRLHMVHVVSATPGWAVGVDGASSAYAQAAQVVFEASSRALEELPIHSSGARVTREMRSGSVAAELAASALEHKADIAVVAAHRRGRVDRFVLGSVAGTLVRVAPCPVLIAGEDRPLPHALYRVLAIVDGSPMSEPVLSHAKAFTEKHGAALRVLSVFDTEAMLRGVVQPLRPVISEMMNLCEARYRAEIESLVRRTFGDTAQVVVDVRAGDDPRQTILDVSSAMDADLVVLGSSGHNAWEGMVLGSIASGVVAGALCPVLMVPAPASRMP